MRERPTTDGRSSSGSTSSGSSSVVSNNGSNAAVALLGEISRTFHYNYPGFPPGSSWPPGHQGSGDLHRFGAFSGLPECSSVEGGRPEQRGDVRRVPSKGETKATPPLNHPSQIGTSLSSLQQLGWNSNEDVYRSFIAQQYAAAAAYNSRQSVSPISPQNRASLSPIPPPLHISPNQMHGTRQMEHLHQYMQKQHLNRSQQQHQQQPQQQQIPRNSPTPPSIASIPVGTPPSSICMNGEFTNIGRKCLRGERISPSPSPPRTRPYIRERTSPYTHQDLEKDQNCYYKEKHMQRPYEDVHNIPPYDREKRVAYDGEVMKYASGGAPYLDSREKKRVDALPPDLSRNESSIPMQSLIIGEGALGDIASDTGGRSGSESEGDRSKHRRKQNQPRRQTVIYPNAPPLPLNQTGISNDSCSDDSQPYDSENRIYNNNIDKNRIYENSFSGSVVTSESTGNVDVSGGAMDFGDMRDSNNYLREFEESIETVELRDFRDPNDGRDLKAIDGVYKGVNSLRPNHDLLGYGHTEALGEMKHLPVPDDRGGFYRKEFKREQVSISSQMHDPSNAQSSVSMCSPSALSPLSQSSPHSMSHISSHSTSHENPHRSIYTTTPISSQSTNPSHAIPPVMSDAMNHALSHPFLAAHLNPPPSCLQEIKLNKDVTIAYKSVQDVPLKHCAHTSSTLPINAAISQDKPDSIISLSSSKDCEKLNEKTPCSQEEKIVNDAPHLMGESQKVEEKSAKLLFNKENLQVMKKVNVECKKTNNVDNSSHIDNARCTNENLDKLVTPLMLDNKLINGVISAAPDLDVSGSSKVCSKPNKSKMCNDLEVGKEGKVDDSSMLASPTVSISEEEPKTRRTRQKRPVSYVEDETDPVLEMNDNFSVSPPFSPTGTKKKGRRSRERIEFEFGDGLDFQNISGGIIRSPAEMGEFGSQSNIKDGMKILEKVGHDLHVPLHVETLYKPPTTGNPGPPPIIATLHSPDVYDFEDTDGDGAGRANRGRRGKKRGSPNKRGRTTPEYSRSNQSPRLKDSKIGSPCSPRSPRFFAIPNKNSSQADPLKVSNCENSILSTTHSNTLLPLTSVPLNENILTTPVTLKQGKKEVSVSSASNLNYSSNSGGNSAQLLDEVEHQLAALHKESSEDNVESEASLVDIFRGESNKRPLSPIDKSKDKVSMLSVIPLEKLMSANSWSSGDQLNSQQEGQFPSSPYNPHFTNSPIHNSPLNNSPVHSSPMQDVEEEHFPASSSNMPLLPNDQIMEDLPLSTELPLEEDPLDISSFTENDKDKNNPPVNDVEPNAHVPLNVKQSKKGNPRGRRPKRGRKKDECNSEIADKLKEKEQSEKEKSIEDPLMLDNRVNLKSLDTMANNIAGNTVVDVHMVSISTEVATVGLGNARKRLRRSQNSDMNNSNSISLPPCEEPLVLSASSNDASNEDEDAPINGSNEPHHSNVKSIEETKAKHRGRSSASLDNHMGDNDDPLLHSHPNNSSGLPDDGAEAETLEDIAKFLEDTAPSTAEKTPQQSPDRPMEGSPFNSPNASMEHSFINKSCSTSGSSYRDSRPKRVSRPPPEMNDSEVNDMMLLLNMDEEESDDEDYVPKELENDEGMESAFESETLGETADEDMNTTTDEEENDRFSSCNNRKMKNDSGRFSKVKGKSNSKKKLRGKKDVEIDVKASSGIKKDMKKKDLCTNRGPLIKIVEDGGEVVSNDATKNDQSDPHSKLTIFNVSLEIGSKNARLGYNSTLHNNYDAFVKDPMWICAFCKHYSHWRGLGDLFGPFFITGCQVAKKVIPQIFEGQLVDDEQFQNQDIDGIIPSSRAKSRRTPRSDQHPETVTDGKKMEVGSISPPSRFVPSATAARLMVRSVPGSPRVLPSPRRPSSSSVSTNAKPSGESGNPIADSGASTSQIFGCSPNSECWVHEECVVWASDTIVINSRLSGLEKAVLEAQENICIHCNENGATVWCLGKGCKQIVHVPCAHSLTWFLDKQTFQAWCSKHNPTKQASLSRGEESLGRGSKRAGR